ncbi:MAG: alpha-1,2-fucosyltransferase [Fischerella sp.]|uniref:alpha-1,2-fucosyltransferase n=1 Tax=Fischerella sp. TaxID=1191 RepID=UPI0017CDF944|nr:alpha-1,2-fucosyltransferase [Fischerella sp.]NWF57768.1 alpha-1,2-fucosyltransferase [Fischerella sp.]
MIIVRLTCGLGNQMFQYAAGRRLAEIHSTLLKLDISRFEDIREYRSYALNCFHIWEHIATPQEIEIFKQRKSKPMGQRLKSLLYRSKADRKFSEFQFEDSILQEQHFHFDPNFFQAPNNVYLDGYWQSEKYFRDIQDIIRREFTVKYPQDPKSQHIAELIGKTNSVSIHIRRGDYVEHPTIAPKHGFCDLDYYDRAISYISDRVSQPHFFIFSDDPHWVKENLHLKFPIIIVDHNGSTRNYEDLRLMSLCQHQIIANSSFSWWGAWLNSNPEKIVIAPVKWFSGIDYDTSDLVPDNWLRM